MDSNQILRTRKDHQICFVCGLEARQTNPRWQTAAILKNRKIIISQQPFDQFFKTKFSMMMHLDPLDIDSHLDL